MKIGILREEKVPIDRRVPFSPAQCKEIITKYPDLKLFVQTSKIRCFSDQEYINLGIEVTDNLEHCDILFGIKEVPKENLIPNKTYLFFSHTIKEQEYNRELLKKIIDHKIRLIDYEVLKYDNGNRILGFGRYAGIIGAYNGLLTYGIKESLYDLKPAYKCIDRLEMDSQLKNVSLRNERFLITGKGRVGLGIIETIKKLNIKEVTKDEYLNKKFNCPIFLHIDVMDYNQRKDGSDSSFEDFIKHSSKYESTFMQYASKTDVYFAGHFYGAGAPYLFTRKDVKSSDFNISVVADVSCDIDGPVACTIRPSSIENPIYGYNPNTESEDNFMSENVVAVMAVDNLPCELPKDSSSDFGQNLIDQIIPILTSSNKIIKRATICENGDLTSNFEYLRSYISS